MQCSKRNRFKVSASASERPPGSEEVNSSNGRTAESDVLVHSLSLKSVNNARSVAPVGGRGFHTSEVSVIMGSLVIQVFSKHVSWHFS